MTPQFFCLFFAFFIGSGSGLMLINNLADIIDADENATGVDKTVFAQVLHTSTALVLP